MEETEELRRFREEWRREVTQRARHEEPAVPSTSNTAISDAASVTSDEPSIAPSSPTTSSISPIISNTVSSFTLASASKSRNQALEFYSQAVQAESQGQLDDALSLYKRAFRLDGNVDKAYHRASLERELTSDFGGLTIATLTKAKARDNADTAKQSVKGSKKPSRNALHGVLVTFPPFDQLVFEPEQENQPVHINKLPDELLVLIMHYFVRSADTRSIERFASVSRKARVLTLDQGIWRELVQSTYTSPQILYSPSLLLSYGDDYREYYKHQPRVRLDGVYIAICHYVRKGHSENAWVHITHLITYHRYLRFLPSGMVLSFLSSDTTASPADIIPHLRADEQKLKGLHTGRWTVEESREDGPIVRIDGLLDTGGTWGMGGIHSTISGPPKYTFGMRLGLRSRPMGRWNKLDILDYHSVHIATDEETPLPLRHEKPYWFSKVRSYGSGLA